ncbi:hypothetical protein [Ekhidna sp.]|uniref:hypothetical protein n=1 Tax=Ekhidna sp. TaxID=2608089 RepID=UPI003299F962
MKSLLKVCIALALSMSLKAQGQWSESGNNYTVGNLGIGIQNTYSQFHVATSGDGLLWPAVINNTRNSSSVTGYGVGLMLKHSHNGEGYKWGGIASVQEGSWANNSGLALFANETEYMRIKNNGNVGIGTTNPNSKFEILSSEVNDLTIEKSNTSDWARLILKRSTDPNYAFFQYYGNTTSGMTLGVTGDNPIRLYSSGAERMRIAGNGNVGIGTSTPQQQLHLTNKLMLNWNDANNVSTNDSPTIYASGQGAAYPFSGRGNLILQPRATDSDGFGDLVVMTGQNATTKFVIRNSGNVGIGTTNPTEKLEVAGTIYSREVKVEVAAGTGPDFVFEPTYDLRSLEETAAYIKSNKHLPEIPSAKEMEANGVQLGEMNMLLLKKIEELTLHTIEQQKQLDTYQQNQTEMMELIHQLKNEITTLKEKGNDDQ